MHLLVSNKYVIIETITSDVSQERSAQTKLSSGRWVWLELTKTSSSVMDPCFRDVAACERDIRKQLSCRNGMEINSLRLKHKMYGQIAIVP